MPEQLPKWCLLLDELIEMAEHELRESEKEGAVPTAPNKDTPHLHPAKKRGDTYNE